MHTGREYGDLVTRRKPAGGIGSRPATPHPRHVVTTEYGTHVRHWRWFPWPRTATARSARVRRTPARTRVRTRPPGRVAGGPAAVRRRDVATRTRSRADLAGSAAATATPSGIATRTRIGRTPATGARTRRAVTAATIPTPTARPGAPARTTTNLVHTVDLSAVQAGGVRPSSPGLRPRVPRAHTARRSCPRHRGCRVGPSLWTSTRLAP